MAKKNKEGKLHEGEISLLQVSRKSVKLFFWHNINYRNKLKLLMTHDPDFFHSLVWKKLFYSTDELKWSVRYFQLKFFVVLLKLPHPWVLRWGPVAGEVRGEGEARLTLVWGSAEPITTTPRVKYRKYMNIKQQTYVCSMQSLGVSLVH